MGEETQLFSRQGILITTYARNFAIPKRVIHGAVSIDRPQSSAPNHHRRVVLQAGRENTRGARLPAFMQFRAQALVRTDATGDDQGIAACCIQRAMAFDGQGIDHRILEAARYVGAGCIALVTFAPGQHHLGLQPAEAEIQSGPVGHGTREPVRARTPGFCQGGQLRPSRIRQAHHLRGLVGPPAGSSGFASSGSFDRIHGTRGVCRQTQAGHEGRLRGRFHRGQRGFQWCTPPPGPQPCPERARGPPATPDQAGPTDRPLRQVCGL